MNQEGQAEAQGETSPEMPVEVQPPGKVKRFIKECIRVLRVTRKPNRTEYLTTVKVTGLGIAIIGFIGFIIFLIRQLIL